MAANDVEKVLQASGQPIVLGHHHHVAGAQVAEHLAQLRPVAHRARHDVREDPLRARRVQRVGLPVEGLLGGGDASVTDDHRGGPSSSLASSAAIARRQSARSPGRRPVATSQITASAMRS